MWEPGGIDNLPDRVSPDCFTQEAWCYTPAQSPHRVAGRLLVAINELLLDDVRSLWLTRGDEDELLGTTVTRTQDGVEVRLGLWSEPCRAARMALRDVPVLHLQRGSLLGYAVREEPSLSARATPEWCRTCFGSAWLRCRSTEAPGWRRVVADWPWADCVLSELHWLCREDPRVATYQPADLRMVLRPARSGAPWLELLFADATVWLAEVDAADWRPQRSGPTGEEWHFGSAENTVWSGASRFRLLDPRDDSDGPLYVPAAMLDFGVPPFAPGEQPPPPADPPLPPPEDLAADAFVREALFVSRRWVEAGRALGEDIVADAWLLLAPTNPGGGHVLRGTAPSGAALRAGHHPDRWDPTWNDSRLGLRPAEGDELILADAAWLPAELATHAVLHFSREDVESPIEYLVPHWDSDDWAFRGVTRARTQPLTAELVADFPWQAALVREVHWVHRDVPDGERTDLADVRVLLVTPEPAHPGLELFFERCTRFDLPPAGGLGQPVFDTDGTRWAWGDGLVIEGAAVRAALLDTTCWGDRLRYGDRDLLARWPRTG